MLLKKLEIRNYRSIKSQSDDNSVVFNGIDCLVGKNNTGKSNVIKSILYLLGKERLDDDIYWNRNTDLEIDVRGYFSITEKDIELLKIEDKKEAIRNLILEDGTIGICRRSSQGGMEVINYFPCEERLKKEKFLEFHSDTWDNRESGSDFESKMRDKYPELISYLTEGKESNKGEWTDAYSRFLKDKPEHIEFEKEPGPPPQGIPADLKNMLPRVIPVPAVKEVSDVTKTTKSAEFGSMLNELSNEVEDELDEAIIEAINEVYRRLNIVEDDETGKVIDDRLPGVRAIEEQISTYVSETFTDISISLEFPPPESKVMFDNARVWINEEGFEKILVDNVGEGVKRVLIFSLFRTLSDFRSGKLSISDTGEKKVSRRSLLVLYEEAELFLHPTLQTILLEIFNNLYDSNTQIVFSTHSPFLIDHSLLKTINLVRKSPSIGTTITECKRELKNLSKKSQNILTQVQNISSYIFADRVVLVEGESDRIVLKKIAKSLNTEWDFNAKGIPILPVLGKGNIPLFHKFLSSLEIECYPILDLDCIKGILNKISDDHEIKGTKSRLIQKCHELAEQGIFDTKVNKDYVDDIVSKYTWQEVIENLQKLFIALSNGKEPKKENLGSLKRLIDKPKKDAWRLALISDHEEIKSIRSQLQELLLEDDILLLHGTIEDYYPNASADKISSALEFDPDEYDRDDLTNLLFDLPGSDKQDLTMFLESVFAK